jgi:hypothetical protein
MDVKKVSVNRSFEGNVIVKNKISTAQNYLFSRHKPVLEQMIKDLPFDLFVEQSKSRKTISLRANVEKANSYIVRKNEQNFVEAANMAISDGMQKSELYQMQLKVSKVFEQQRLLMVYVNIGKFKEAREAEKEFAKVAVENFNAYKLIPLLKFRNVPRDIAEMSRKNCRKYFFYRLFSPKTKDERTFAKMKKEFEKQLKAEGNERKVQIIDFPPMYY